MNFTELSELNEMLFNFRNPHSVYCSQISALHFNGDHFLNQSHNIHSFLVKEFNFVPFEVLLDSSFKEWSHCKDNYKEDESLKKLYNQDVDEDIDKILADINKNKWSLELFPSKNIPRKSKDLNKPLMLICSSPSLKEIEPPPNEKLFPTRLKRAITFNEEDNDSFEKDLLICKKNEKDFFEEPKTKLEDSDISDKEEYKNELNRKKKILAEKNKKKNQQKANPAAQNQTFDHRKTHMRKNTITILSDCSKKPFQKVKEYEIIGSFKETIKRKSSLSQNLMNKLELKGNFRLHHSNSTLNLKEITVFFFSTPTKLKIPINVKSTVNEVIRTIINYYMVCEHVDHSLMKYPLFPEAYELRSLEDDDDYKPEMSFDPLAGDRIFIEYNIDSLAFCEIFGFTPESNKEKSCSNLYLLEKDKKMQEIVLEKRQQNVVQIDITEQNMSTFIPVSPEGTIKEIFHLLKRKIKINPKKYLLRALNFEEFSNDQDQDEINVNMPLKSLKTKKLQLVRKIFADDPEPNFNDFISNQTQCYSYENDSLDETKYLMNGFQIEINENQANVYEEFEISKIKTNGSKNPRLLGINKYRIFNKYNEKPEGGILSFFNFFAVSKKTKYPERLIEAIQDVDFIEGTDNQFYIDFLEPNNKLKRIVYEGAKKTVFHILTKLGHLIGKKIKRKLKKKIVRKQ